MRPMTTGAPRLPNGRVLRALCDDPNCDGTLRADMSFGQPIWACDGLTHDTDTGPLRACERTFDRLVVMPLSCRERNGG